jgi:hypothetical protein
MVNTKVPKAFLINDTLGIEKSRKFQNTIFYKTTNGK